MDPESIMLSETSQTNISQSHLHVESNSNDKSHKKTHRKKIRFVVGEKWRKVVNTYKVKYHGCNVQHYYR